MAQTRKLGRRALMKGSAVVLGAGALSTIDFGGRSAGQLLAGLAQTTPGSIDLSRDRVVASLPAGSGPGQVAILKQPAHGPTALALGANGEIHVLDAFNQRIVTLGSTGAVRGDSPISTGYGRDLRIAPDGRAFVLGTEEVLVLAGLGGSVSTRLPLDKRVAGSATGLAPTSGPDLVLEMEHADRLQVTEGGAPSAPTTQASGRLRRLGLTASGSERSFVTRYEPGEPSRRGATLESVGPSGVVQRFPIRVQHGVGSAKVLGVDQRGNTYVVVTELAAGDEVRVDRTVRRYDPSGAVGGVARVPVAGRHSVPERDLALSPDGEVYCLVVMADRAMVVRLGFVDQLPTAPSLSSGVASVVAAALQQLGVRPTEAMPLLQTRSGAINTAFSFYSHQWWCSYGNWLTCSGSTRPPFITGYNQYFYEVPYQWGGYRSTAQFDGDMGAGRTAGDVNTNYWKSCASGVDCSGFVQNCWAQMAQKYNDTGLTAFCNGTVGNTSLQQADMWRLPNDHVRLHDYYRSDWAGAYVYEASVANSSRVWWRFYDWNGLTGYTGWQWRGY